MLLPHLARSTLLLGGTPAPLPTLLISEAPAVPGPQLVDAFYITGVLAVAAFGLRQVFDSTFAENTDEFSPPMPGATFPFMGDEKRADPEEAAEALRQRLQAAAEAGDLETAFRLEKELVQLLAETGVRYMVDDENAPSEKLPDRW
jgi:hypothetical protein